MNAGWRSFNHPAQQIVFQDQLEVINAAQVRLGGFGAANARDRADVENGARGGSLPNGSAMAPNSATAPSNITPLGLPPVFARPFSKRGIFVRVLLSSLYLTARGISIRVVPTRISIVSNALLFGTIITNLVSNAVKYAQPGGRVLLGCRRFGQSVRIDVLDTGDGIADNGIPRPFETFSRIDFSHSGGLGSGLVIVRQAVKILGHRMEVSSAAGRGSRFSVVAMRA